MLWHSVRTGFHCLFNGGFEYYLFYMSPFPIAGSIGCLHVQFTLHLSLGVAQLHSKLSARGYISVYCVSVDGSLISHQAGRSLTISMT